jgi:MoxR-like ATPase
MPFPERDDELVLARRMLGHDNPEVALASGVVQPLLTVESLEASRRTLELLAVRDEMLGYILDVVRATRTHEAVLVGAGPRATQSLLMSSRAVAALSARDFVSPDDVRGMVLPVLEHRLILRPEYEVEGLSIAEVLQQILQTVPVPR